MSRQNVRVALREALQGYYADGGAQFWQIAADNRRAAVAAFRRKPEVFGSYHAHYTRWAKSRQREHLRISGLMQAWLATCSGEMPDEMEVV